MASEKVDDSVRTLALPIVSGETNRGSCPRKKVRQEGGNQESSEEGGKKSRKKISKKFAKMVVKKVAKKVGSKAPTAEEIGPVAYLLFLRREETGAPGSAEGDWLEAERLLSK